MAVTITPDDVRALAPNLAVERIEAVIPGAIATAIVAAPDLATVAPDSNEAMAAKLIISAAIVRLVGSAGGGGAQGINQQSAGPFSVNYSPVVGTFSDKELRQLKALFGAKAFSIDHTPTARRQPNWWRPIS